MKRKLIFLVALFIFGCQTDRSIIDEETFYEALVNGELVRNSNVTYTYFGPQSKITISCHHYSEEGFLRRTILFENVTTSLNNKVPLHKDQWGANDHSDATVNLTTWQSDGDVYAETYNLINENDAWIQITKYEDDFLEGEANFTLAFDSTLPFSNGRVYPEISDTLIYQDFKFRAYFVD